ncbi:MAG: type II toxin-antitoxin system death-on-curing family toxin [candidate division NC10 bacterium]|nr:type II toxin-antitoxin system death-on-curing family toxin [candidate division NC10 bacterium]MBI4839661.1 type II toxin-antitoxin system death-on-curing family toxin [candidate division NC10 bacterium]
MPTIFLELDEVIEIHQDQIQRYGGRPGIRDMRLLQSAVAMPRVGVGTQYLHTDLFEMAAAYLFHLVQNHPFVDGNKRAGAVAALVFLTLNGVRVRVTNPALVEIIFAVAEGKIGKGAVAEFLRQQAHH